MTVAAAVSSIATLTSTLTEGFFCSEKAYFVFGFLHFAIKINKTRRGGAGKWLRASAHVLRTAGLANISFFPHIV